MSRLLILSATCLLCLSACAGGVMPSVEDDAEDESDRDGLSSDPEPDPSSEPDPEPDSDQEPDPSPEPSACNPNPCSSPPASFCDAEVAVSHRVIGSCLEVDEEAVCSYQEIRQDCAPQDLVCEDGACIVFRHPSPRPGDLAIVEFMPDPNTLSDEDAEWVEMVSLSDHTLDLSQCALKDDHPTADGSSLMGLVVEAGARVLLGRKASPGLNGGLEVDALFSFGLNNGGDTITLNCEGAIIDQVEYSRANGFTLSPGVSVSLDPSHVSGERGDASNWCEGQSNYHSDNLGTPGQPNPPCDASPACSPACEADEVCQEGQCIPLNTEPGVRAPARGELIITEIMFDPQTLSDNVGEWFEIYNTSDAALDLGGCTVRDAAANSDPASLAGVRLEPGALMVLGRSTELASNGGIDMVATFSYALNNGGDVLTLTCGDEVMVEVDYGDAAFPGGSAGVSLSLDPAHFNYADSSQGIYWCLGSTTYTDNNHGTPGSPNTDCGL